MNAGEAGLDGAAQECRVEEVDEGEGLVKVAGGVGHGAFLAVGHVPRDLGATAGGELVDGSQVGACKG